MATNGKPGAQPGRLGGSAGRSPIGPAPQRGSPPGEHRSQSHDQRPRIELGRAAASPEEAAAIAAAIEQFLRDTAPGPVAPGPAVSPWLRAGLYEHAGLDPAGPSPWGDGEPWGR